MFMNEDEFDGGGSNRRNIDVSSGHAGNFSSSSSSSRSKVLRQQRELQKKKMQNRLATSSPKNFSSPRSKDIDNRPSRFGRFSSDEDSDDQSDDDSGFYKRGKNRNTNRNKKKNHHHYSSEEDDGIEEIEDLDDDGNFERSKKNRNRNHHDTSYSSEEEEKRSSYRSKKYRDDDDDDSNYHRPTMQKKNSKKKHFRREHEDNTYEYNDDNESEYNEEESSIKKSSKKQAAKALDMSDMRKFLMEPITPAHDVVECYIERNKSGTNKLFPEYCLYLKNGDRFLLTAKKRPKNKTSNYLISMQRGDLSRTSSNYLGKLRANFVGTEFVVYDRGETKGSEPRQELACAVYASNVLGSRGPRKMRVCVPKVKEDGSRMVFQPSRKDEEMMVKFKEEDHTQLTYLINKPPRWNEQVGAYVLNFNGRVTMASVKNFQLVTPEDQETVVLQFGRVGKDIFTMDFRAPLCPFQAFAITLSSFDSKLACE